MVAAHQDQSCHPRQQEQRDGYESISPRWMVGGIEPAPTSPFSAVHCGSLPHRTLRATGCFSIPRRRASAPKRDSHLYTAQALACDALWGTYPVVLRCKSATSTASGYVCPAAVATEPFVVSQGCRRARVPRLCFDVPPGAGREPYGELPWCTSSSSACHWPRSVG